MLVAMKSAIAVKFAVYQNEINILKVSLNCGQKQSETSQFIYAHFILIRVRLWCDNACGLCCFRCIFKESILPTFPKCIFTHHKCNSRSSFSSVELNHANWTYRVLKIDFTIFNTYFNFVS